MPQIDPSSRVYVAGHRGLVGSAVMKWLAEAGVETIARTRDELDLRDGAAVEAFFDAESPTHVVLAAAKVGGILANATYPADFVADNLAIALNVIQAAHKSGVGARGRLVFLGSSCIYPRLAPQPMREKHLLTGPLEPTNRPYAIAKIAGVELAESLHRQHGDDMISLMPTNLYGPGDNFDDKSSHVLPALMARFERARQSGTGEPVTVWGSGTPRREFLYSEDLADAVFHVLTQTEADIRAVAPNGLLNVGTGVDVTIRELAESIREVVGAPNPLAWDAEKPDGTPRKLLEVSRMAGLGWRASTALTDGLAATYDWYRAQISEPNASATSA